MPTKPIYLLLAGCLGLFLLAACVGERTPDATQIAQAAETESAIRAATETEASTPST